MKDRPVTTVFIKMYFIINILIIFKMCINNFETVILIRKWTYIENFFTCLSLSIIAWYVVSFFGNHIINHYLIGIADRNDILENIHVPYLSFWIWIIKYHLFNCCRSIALIFNYDLLYFRIFHKVYCSLGMAVCSNNYWILCICFNCYHLLFY